MTVRPGSPVSFCPLFGREFARARANQLREKLYLAAYTGRARAHTLRSHGRGCMYMCVHADRYVHIRADDGTKKNNRDYAAGLNRRIIRSRTKVEPSIILEPIERTTAQTSCRQNCPREARARVCGEIREISPATSVNFGAIRIHVSRSTSERAREPFAVG